jgi:hypothetical protein
LIKSELLDQEGKQLSLTAIHHFWE